MNPLFLIALIIGVARFFEKAAKNVTKQNTQQTNKTMSLNQKRSPISRPNPAMNEGARKEAAKEHIRFGEGDSFEGKELFKTDQRKESNKIQSSDLKDGFISDEGKSFEWGKEMENQHEIFHEDEVPKHNPFLNNFSNSDSLVNAIVVSEVLSKPKSLRK